MKRKLIVYVAALLSMTAGVNAQNEEHCFKPGTSAINVGLGIGNTISYANPWGTAVLTPAFTASYEYGIMQLGPGIIGAGLEFGYHGTHYTYADDYGYVLKEKWTTLAFSPRATYHFDFLNGKKYDVYPIVQINIYNYGYSYTQTGSNNGYIYTPANSGSAGVRPSILVAARYFFTPNFGVYSEFGYDICILKAGLSLKFGGK